jgi:hypothetical protein
MAAATTYNGKGRGTTCKSDEVSQITRKTVAQAIHRKETSQRAPSGGSFMGQFHASTTGNSAKAAAIFSRG